MGSGIKLNDVRLMRTAKRLLSLVGNLHFFEKVKMRFLKPSLLLLAVCAILFSTTAFAQGTPQKGVQVGDIDTKADPCTDFFEFANGKWRAENPIPASMVRWSRRWQA